MVNIVESTSFVELKWSGVLATEKWKNFVGVQWKDLHLVLKGQLHGEEESKIAATGKSIYIT